MGKKRWTKTIVVEFAAILVALILIFLGLDLFFQCETVLGRVVGETRHEQFVTTKSGSYVVVHESNVVRYDVNGESWEVKLPKKKKMGFIEVNYYKRWPKIAWVGGPYVGPIMLGLASIFSLGFVAAVEWVRRIKWEPQMEDQGKSVG